MKDGKPSRKLPKRIGVRADAAFLFVALHGELIKAMKAGRIPPKQLQTLAGWALARMMKTAKAALVRHGVKGARVLWHEGRVLDGAPEWDDAQESKSLTPAKDTEELRLARERMEAEFKATIARVLGDDKKSGGADDGLY